MKMNKTHEPASTPKMESMKPRYSDSATQYPGDLSLYAEPFLIKRQPAFPEIDPDRSRCHLVEKEKAK
jgi:hypothetical protein